MLEGKVKRRCGWHFTQRRFEYLPRSFTGPEKIERRRWHTEDSNWGSHPRIGVWKRKAPRMIIGGSAFTGSSGTDQLDHERDRQMRDRPIQAYPSKTYGRLMEALVLLVSL